MSQPSEPPPGIEGSTPSSGPLTRIGRIVFGSLATAASLIAFPQVIPWMVAFWLLWFSVAAVRGRLAVVPLLLMTLCLLAKGVAVSPPVWVLGALVAGIAIWRILRRMAGREWRTAATWQTAAVWIVWTWVLVDDYLATHTSRAPRFDPERPIACLGDSLTAYGYPDVLAARVAAPVTNHGRDGITTADAIERLPAVLAENPQVIIAELGGHDYLKGHGRAETRANLEKIIQTCRSRGAEVILVEIPRGLVYDRYHGLERDLARRHDLELVPDSPIRRMVLWSPYGPPGMWLPKEQRLSDDGLHPNAAGNQLLADHVTGALKRMYGPAAIREP